MRKTALLVIDVQCGVFDGKLCPPIDGADSLLERTVALIEAARDGGVPVVYVQHCEDADSEFKVGTPQWELHPSLAPLPTDPIIRKYASSAFEGTPLAETLQKENADQVVLCGLQSEYCIANTAKAALANGLSVVIARDAHRTWPSEGKSATEISEQVNRELASLGATLTDTAALRTLFREQAV